MGVLRQPPPNPTNHHHCLSAAATAFALLFFATALSTHLPLGSGGLILVVGAKQEREETMKALGSEEVLERFLTRRRLVGPGSSPPTCRSKCSNCFPCKPVHVPIQPGRTMPLEYYPEAWRCKCGNNLFMP